MKIAGFNLKDVVKLCVLQFDEMKILSAHKYTKKLSSYWATQSNTSNHGKLDNL